MFIFAEFQLGEDKIKLILPEKEHAKDLYKIVEEYRSDIARWLPWADETNSVEDELNFIKFAREETANYKALILTILMNDKPVGMLDLHNISEKNRRAEVGYWISNAVQGRGIMTESVKRLVDIAFNALNLHKITIIAESENIKSRAVAERLNFEYEATLKEHLIYKEDFKDFVLYSKCSKH